MSDDDKSNIVLFEINDIPGPDLTLSTSSNFKEETVIKTEKENDTDQNNEQQFNNSYNNETSKEGSTSTTNERFEFENLNSMSDKRYREHLTKRYPNNKIRISENSMKLIREMHRVRKNLFWTKKKLEESGFEKKVQKSVVNDNFKSKPQVFHLKHISRSTNSDEKSKDGTSRINEADIDKRKLLNFEINKFLIDPEKNSVLFSTPEDDLGNATIHPLHCASGFKYVAKLETKQGGLLYITKNPIWKFCFQMSCQMPNCKANLTLYRCKVISPQNIHCREFIYMHSVPNTDYVLLYKTTTNHIHELNLECQEFLNNMKEYSKLGIGIYEMRKLLEYENNDLNTNEADIPREKFQWLLKEESVSGRWILYRKFRQRQELEDFIKFDGEWKLFSQKVVKGKCHQTEQDVYECTAARYDDNSCKAQLIICRTLDGDHLLACKSYTGHTCSLLLLQYPELFRVPAFETDKRSLSYKMNAYFKSEMEQLDEIGFTVEAMKAYLDQHSPYNISMNSLYIYASRIPGFNKSAGKKNYYRRLNNKNCRKLVLHGYKAVTTYKTVSDIEKFLERENCWQHLSSDYSSDGFKHLFHWKTNNCENRIYFDFDGILKCITHFERIQRSYSLLEQDIVAEEVEISEMFGTVDSEEEIEMELVDVIEEADIVSSEKENNSISKELFNVKEEIDLDIVKYEEENVELVDVKEEIMDLDSDVEIISDS